MNNEISVLKEELQTIGDTVTQIYMEQNVIRAGIMAIPWIGNYIDLCISSKGQKIVERRILKFFNELKERMNNVEEQTLDKSYIESEEFFDLLMKAIESSTKTRDNKKIELYAQIIKGAVSFSLDDFSPEEYLHVLSELTPKEVEVALTFYMLRVEKEDKNWALSLCSMCNIDNEDLPLLMGRIQATGLIYFTVDGGTFDSDGEMWKISPSFIKLVEFLKS